MTGDEALAESLTYLRAHLDIRASEVTSHTAIVVKGLDQPDAVRHFGRFLVGAIAQAIGTDLNLYPVMVADGLDGQAELRRDVEKIIGRPGETLSDHERTHGRDPWIGEALAHLLLVLSGEPPNPCTPAPVVASHLPHVEAREHGLDVFGFANPEFVALIGEVKTSRSNIRGLLDNAESSLKEIEDGKRDHHLRQAANGLRTSLPTDLRPLLEGSFWRQARCYIPVIVFQEGVAVDEVRPALQGLAPDIKQRRLVIAQHANHDQFMTKVAHAMRDAIGVISPA